MTKPNSRLLRFCTNTGFVGLVMLCASCGQVPGLDDPVDDTVEAGPYPDLLPYHQLPSAPQGRLTEESEADLEARAARLKRRANSL